MNICGIVCEYNPFHLGHAWQIAEIRRRLGEEAAVVCIMSGDFVQRGEAAAFPKHDRARAAVAGGADLVLELPLPWCIASAERFASGAVGALAASGIVTHLAFGSECGDAGLLEETAALLGRPELDALVREKLTEGVGYAAARQAAAERLAGRALPLLAAPNDILALEYLKALKQTTPEITPLVLPRQGAAHDSEDEAELPSASFLRQRLNRGEDISRWIPPAAAAALAQGSGPVDRGALETALLSRLRFLSEEDFALLPDAGEGLWHRLYRAAHTEASPEAVLDAASSKRYTKARLRRMCLCAALRVRAGDSDGCPPYLRVLAAGERGAELLRRMEARAVIPVLTKPASVRRMSTDALRCFTLGAQAADLYALALPESADRRGDRDWRTSPVFIK